MKFDRDKAKTTALFGRLKKNISVRFDRSRSTGKGYDRSNTLTVEHDRPTFAGERSGVGTNSFGRRKRMALDYDSYRVSIYVDRSSMNRIAYYTYTYFKEQWLLKRKRYIS